MREQLELLLAYRVAWAAVAYRTDDPWLLRSAAYLDGLMELHGERLAELIQGDEDDVELEAVG